MSLYRFFTHEHTSPCTTSAFSAPALQGVMMVTGRTRSCAIESVQDDSSAFIHWANNIKRPSCRLEPRLLGFARCHSGHEREEGNPAQEGPWIQALVSREPHDWVRMTPVPKVSIGLPSAISKCWEKVRVAKQILPAFVARLLPLTWPSNKARSD